MFWMLLRAPWLIAALLVNAVTLLAQRDSATTRVVPVWRDGQLVTRVSGDPSVAGGTLRHPDLELRQPNRLAAHPPRR